MNPAAPLPNTRHERLACGLAKGMSQTEAWVDAGYSARGANGNASREIAKDSNGITERVAWLQAQAATEAVLTIAEKRAFLAAVVRTPIGSVGKDSPLCQELVETVGAESSSTRLRMPDKLRAIQLDNDLAEDGAEAQASKAIAIVIRRAWASGVDAPPPNRD